MKFINYLIEKINENENVKISYKTFPKELKINVNVTWDCNFTHSETFESKQELSAYLKGFYDALPLQD